MKDPAADTELKPYTEKSFAKTAVCAVIAALRVFLPDTPVKRTACFILLAAGMPDWRIAALTDAGERTVRRYRRERTDAGSEEDAVRMLTIKNRPGRGAGPGAYRKRSRQEAARIIRDKFGTELSVTAASRLLKKKGLFKRKCGPFQPGQT